MGSREAGRDHSIEQPNERRLALALRVNAIANHKRYWSGLRHYKLPLNKRLLKDRHPEIADARIFRVTLGRHSSGTSYLL